jgi:DNA-binding NarL/FixJ family response regulator
LVCRGYPNKLIAQELNLAEGTVKIHLHAVFRKLNVSSRAALMVKLSNQ